MTFGERLKYLMDEKEVTQKQVSKQLNIAISTLNGYANDYREPDFATLSSLSQYFGVSTDFLLGLTSISTYDSQISDEQLLRLIHCYNELTPEMQVLLLEEAKLLVKYSFVKDKRKE